MYDGKGRLRKRTDYIWTGSAWTANGGAEYIYDGMRVIQERNTSNTPTVSYTRGTDLSGSLEGAGGIGGLLGRSHGYSAGNWSTHSFYHADGNGNVTYLLNSAQTKVAEYRYDPYGNTISISGSLAGVNVYRFSSKELHVNSGLYYYGYRFYDPNLQRWLNRDPFFGELNTAFPANGALQRNAILASEVSQLYGFCFNNPVNTFDTDGLIAPIPIIMAGLAIGNCAIGAYELIEYFKCMGRALEINKQATEKLPVDQAIKWCRMNRGQECTELLSDAAGRGLRCGLWGAGRLLLIKIGINPILGGKAGGG